MWICCSESMKILIQVLLRIDRQAVINRMQPGVAGRPTKILFRPGLPASRYASSRRLMLDDAAQRRGRMLHEKGQ